MPGRGELDFWEVLKGELGGGVFTINDGHDICGLVANGFWVAEVLIGPVARV